MTPSESEEELSSQDIKKIKALILEQDETIEAHEKKIEDLTKELKTSWDWRALSGDISGDASDSAFPS